MSYPQYSTTYTAYGATLTKPLVRQLLALIQRDERAALDFVGGANVLPDFASYQLAPLTIPQFPSVLVVPTDVEFDRDSSGGALRYVARLEVEIAVLNQDPQMLAELAQDYLAAMTALLTSLPLSDFYADHDLRLPILGAAPAVAAALAIGSVKDLWIARHEISEIRKKRDGSGFAMAAGLEVLVDREES